MKKRRIEYEFMIRNTILFSLDRESQPTAYRREALKLVENLYLYLLEINEERYREYGLEITETANSCIKNFDPGSGDFLNYFNRSIATAYRKSFCREQIQAQHGGMHFPENDQRTIRKYIKYAESCGVYGISSELIDQIVSATGMTRERVLECITNYYGSFAQSDVCSDDDGVIVSAFDLMASGEDIDKRILDDESAAVFLLHVDDVYSKRQHRQRPLLSRLLTLKVSQQLQADEKLLVFAQDLSFFDKELYLEICSTREALTVRDICMRMGINEQSASRSYRVFLSLL